MELNQTYELYILTYGIVCECECLCECERERETEDKQKQCKEEEKRAAIQTVNYLTKAANERKLNTKQEARNSIKHTAKI